MDKKSIVQYIPKKSTSKCGYCKSKNGSKQTGLWAFQLTTQDYQSLVDRGWRRCGHYCYKPILAESCCAMYTIRCEATNFQLRRSQKRVLKNAAIFFKSGDIRRKLHSESFGGAGGGGDLNILLEEGKSSITEQGVKSTRDERPSVATEENIPKIAVGPMDSSPAQVKPATSEERSMKNMNKAKQMRILRKREKLIAKGIPEDELSKKMIEKKKYPVVKNVENFIDEAATDLKNKLEVRLVRSSPPSEEFEKSLAESYALYCKYQITVHKDKPDSLSQDSYERFLVRSPLIAEGDQGSFHQQYWLNGKLVAVGVIDILPICVSSVYLYYDPDYSFLSLGTYSSLREVHLVRSMNKDNPRFKFYYMGFYIRTCPKMRYKGSLTPSFLLCPEVYSWHPIGKCLPEIDRCGYARLNENKEAIDENEGKGADVSVVYKNALQLLEDVPRLVHLRNGVSAYLKTVGAECARRVILQLQ